MDGSTRRPDARSATTSSLHRIDWPDDGSVEFVLPYGAWIRLFHANGLVVEDLIEIQAPEGGDPGQCDFVDRRLGAPVAFGADLEGARSSSLVARPLLLASTSPQRRAILEQLGIAFDVVAPAYEEHDPPGLPPKEAVRRHAAGKARSVAGRRRDGPVLGVDTAVVLDGARVREAGERRGGAGDARVARRARRTRSSPGSA